MPAPPERNDWLTLSAIGLAAMSIVTFDHEALGHGSVCLAVHGHIRLLTSSLFRCDVSSGWIDAGGPVMNFLIGMAALLARPHIPKKFLKIRLLLIFITAFSFFWEGGYLLRSMLRGDGDLYFFMEFLLGSVAGWQRWLGAAIGLALFVLSARVTSRALLEIWPDPCMARSLARTVWLAATLSATLAAATYASRSSVANGWADLRDAFLEIGGASFLLLVIPRRKPERAENQQGQSLVRSYSAIVCSLGVYVLFVLTMGRGIGV
jgi:hypothetical protein